MRRSRQISLVLVATVSATALGACDGTPPDTQVMGEFFKDTAECVAAYQTEEHGSKTQTESEAICKQADDEAKTEHAKTAPKFSTRADCEKEFGPEACVSAPQQQAAATPGAPAPQQQASGGGGGGIQESFMPFMLGYMLGGSGSNRQVTPTYYGPGSYREPDRDRRQVYTGGSAGAGAAGAAAPRPIGYVYRPPPSTPGSIRVPSASVMSPSRSTGGVPTPSSISNSMRSSTSLGSSSSFGRSGSFGGSSSSISSSSARGGFGSTGGGFSSGG